MDSQRFRRGSVHLRGPAESRDRRGGAPISRKGAAERASAAGSCNAAP